jgi:hypothetical protein
MAALASSLPSPMPRSSVRRVSAPGAIALTVTPVALQLEGGNEGEGRDALLRGTVVGLTDVAVDTRHRRGVDEASVVGLARDHSVDACEHVTDTESDIGYVCALIHFGLPTQQTGLGVDHRCEGHATGLGAELSEAGYGQHHQTLVGCGQFPISDTGPVEHSGPEVLDEDICRCCQPTDDRPTRREHEVDGDTALAGVHVREETRDPLSHFPEVVGRRYSTTPPLRRQPPGRPGSGRQRDQR